MTNGHMIHLIEANATRSLKILGLQGQGRGNVRIALQRSRKPRHLVNWGTCTDFRITVFVFVFLFLFLREVSVGIYGGV